MGEDKDKDKDKDEDEAEAKAAYQSRADQISCCTHSSDPYLQTDGRQISLICIPSMG